MTSRTSSQTKDIRHGEEGVSASILGPSENRIMNSAGLFVKKLLLQPCAAHRNFI